MNNPYIVQITLNAKFASSRAAHAPKKKHAEIKNHILKMGENDKYGNTLCYTVADSSDTHYKMCLNLALTVWKKRFGISKRDLANETLLKTIVLGKLNASSNIEPLAAARVEFCETNNTRTAKIYSLASYYDGRHHGSILLQKIAELAAGAQCQFMTVDVSRPQITQKNGIMRFLADKIEAVFWKDEKPTPYKKHDDIASSKRTERVERLLGFYKRNGFCFCIKRDSSDAHKGDQFQTLWGRVDPFYSYTLVAVLDTHNRKVSSQNPRLIPWTTAWDLRNNYDSYDK
jgi:hypothetical protein